MSVKKNGNKISYDRFEQDIEDAKEALGEDFEYDIPIGEEPGFVINRPVNGWGFRAFGGLGVNLFFLKVDAAVMYDILGKSLGAQVGLRLQF
jgi:hypothetical protein